MIQNFPPELDGELRRAVELDPNDAEAWGWLANSLQAQNRLHEALAARNRAAEIDPLWYWTAANKIGTLGQLKDWKGIDEEIARVQKLGDPILLAKARFNAASASNHPGDEIRLLLDLRSRYPDQSSWVDNRIFAPLMQLGFTEEAMLAWHLPLYVAKNYRGIPDSAEVIKRDWPRPLDLWTDGDEAIALYGRLLPKQGRFREYIGYYDAAFKSPEDLISLWALTPGHFVGTAPTLAANLRAAARGEEADKILSHAEAIIEPALKNGPPTNSDLAALAYIRGAQGRDDEAVKMLGEIVDQGWLPDRMYQATDIAEEPCFERLVNRADFQAIRKRIFERVEEERRKVPLASLAKAYPTKGQRAA
jgi:tetratricopeptide (TPR) repeat protein